MFNSLSKFPRTHSGEGTKFKVKRPNGGRKRKNPPKEKCGWGGDIVQKLKGGGGGGRTPSKGLRAKNGRKPGGVGEG